MVRNKYSNLPRFQRELAFFSDERAESSSLHEFATNRVANQTRCRINVELAHRGRFVSGRQPAYRCLY